MNEPGFGGVFADRQTRLRLSEISILIGPDGQPQISVGTPDLAYDIWPLWLGIAFDHKRTARAARTCLESIAGPHGERHGRALQDETSAGMVTIAASVFAIDAFYASVLVRIDDPPPWGRKSRRYAIIAETLKRALTMSQAGSNAVHERLREAFRFRNIIVHPTGDFRENLLHPVMRVGVAMPHVAFSVENAEAITTMIFSLIEQCASVPKARHKPLVAWCEGICSRAT